MRLAVRWEGVHGVVVALVMMTLLAASLSLTLTMVAGSSWGRIRSGSPQPADSAADPWRRSDSAAEIQTVQLDGE